MPSSLVIGDFSRAIHLTVKTCVAVMKQGFSSPHRSTRKLAIAATQQTQFPSRRFHYHM
jgi:hypothetical protein